MRLSIRFKAKNARIAERSIPPIGGIMPLKAFRYGSVIELIEAIAGLDQSKFGNQLNRTLTIRTRE